MKESLFEKISASTPITKRRPTISAYILRYTHEKRRHPPNGAVNIAFKADEELASEGVKEE